MERKLGVSIYLGRCACNWVTADIGTDLPIQRCLFPNVSSSMADGIAVIPSVMEVARTGQAGTGSLLQNTQLCQVSFPSFNDSERMKCWCFKLVTRYLKKYINLNYLRKENVRLEFADDLLIKNYIHHGGEAEDAHRRSQ
jgi:hypothetical protein